MNRRDQTNGEKVWANVCGDPAAAVAWKKSDETAGNIDSILYASTNEWRTQFPINNNNTKTLIKMGSI